MPSTHFVHVVFCDTYADSAYEDEAEAESFVLRKNAEAAKNVVQMDRSRPVRVWRTETVRIYRKGEERP